MEYTFDSRNLKTTANAGKTKTGIYGYFSNDLESLKSAVKRNRTGLKVVYAELEYILPECNERRFGCSCGNFSLFYALDKSLDKNRY